MFIIYVLFVTLHGTQSKVGFYLIKTNKQKRNKKKLIKYCMTGKGTHITREILPLYYIIMLFIWEVHGKIFVVIISVYL